MAFFQGFTLDTLLGCISCIIGVVALFIGTKAYKDCKIVKSSLNDHKEFKDNSFDYSQRAAGDIVNNNCDVEALVTLTAANFETSLKKAYSMFDLQTKTNLQQIIEKTEQIIQEQKPNLAGLTKLDWINIYFESAKNTSDKYMQDIWAKLLARELEYPGSFSYKTLDVLKNMSSDDFRRFEKLCTLEIEGWIFQEDIHSKNGLSYIELVKLNEYGLLNMGLLQNTYPIKPHEFYNLVYKSFLIRIENTSDEEISISHTVYLLSTVAKELFLVANFSSSEEYAKDCVEVLSKTNNNIKVTLHRINYRHENEINYQLDDLYSGQDNTKLEKGETNNF